MYIYLVRRSSQTVLKLLVFLFSFYLGFTPALVYAAGEPWDYDYKKAGRWAAKFQNIIGESNYYKILEARGEKEIIESGTKKTVSASARVTVSATEVGGVMSKRIAQGVAGGGVALLGVAATQALLEGIGWVMEEGVYVKKKVEDPKHPEMQYLFGAGWNFTNVQFKSTPEEACQGIKNDPLFNDYWKSIKTVSGPVTNYPYDTGFRCEFEFKDPSRSDEKYYQGVYRQPNPNYDPNSEPKEETIPITDEQIGCAIFGTCYHDPVDPTIDTQVNNGVGNPDIVTKAATPDENAGENDQSNPITKKVNNALDAAPKTTEKEGTDGKTESTTEKTTDENGNEQTKTTGDFKLPAFCDWAAVVCDWIDWTKEEPEQPEQQEPDQIETPDVDMSIHDYITGTKQCPEDRRIPVSIGGLSTDIVISYSPLCTVATQFAPAVVLMSSVAALMIVTGTGRRAEVEG